MLPLDIETMSSLTHLLAAFNIFKSELAVTRPSYRKSFNDLINDKSEEENEDFQGNRDEDYMEHEVKDEEVPPEPHQAPDPEMEECTNQLEPYGSDGSPPKLRYC